MAKIAIRERDVAFLETLRERVQKSPEEEEGHRQLGLGLLGAGYVEQAQEVLEAAQARFPNNLELVYALAIVLKRRGISSGRSNSFSKWRRKPNPCRIRRAILCSLAWPECRRKS